MPRHEIREALLWISRDDLATELRQCRDEGKDVSAVEKRFEELMALDEQMLRSAAQQAACGALLDECAQLPMAAGYPYVEPDELEAIRGECGEAFAPREALSEERLFDCLHGAILGRCIGCLLGKPLETVRSDRLWPFLKESGQWPLRGWIDYRREPGAAAYTDLHQRGAWQQEHTGMPVDDDINYTVAALKILEENGAGFTPADVGTYWLLNIPILQTCTAERIAYRNMSACISPPRSARWRNPCREYIGAQIRADTYGYVNVGNPRRAAEFAWRDAAVSHVKNGLYGSMCVAAMIAAAPYCRTADEIVCTGLAEIPRRSRLHAELEMVRGWRAAGLSYDEAIQRIHARWDEADWYHWTHTIPNAAICVAALLWGDGDFSTTVGMAVQACFDTDCNGATAGSIVGAMIGASAIPAAWSARIANTMHTVIPYNNTRAVDEFARRVVALRARLLSEA